MFFDGRKNFSKTKQTVDNERDFIEAIASGNEERLVELLRRPCSSNPMLGQARR